MEKKLLQIIDVNLNRSREGLRVCEDIARFTIKDKNIVKSLKRIRHSVTGALLHSKNLPLRKLIQTRDTKTDGLKYRDFRKIRGTDITDIFMSNIERVKESLRVLEECCKIMDEDISRKYRRLRFNAYDVEKEAVKTPGHISCNR